MSLGIIYRLDKNAPLTFAETDGNFRKLEDAYDRLFTAFQEGLPVNAVAFNDYAADQIRYRRSDNGTQNHLTIARFAESLVGQAPVQVGPTANAYEVLVADPNATPGVKAKRVGLSALLPPLLEAKLYTGINSLTLLADGRVSAVHSTADAAGLRALLKTVTPIVVPLKNAATTVDNPIKPALPMLMRVVAVCQADVDGYVANDELNIEVITSDLDPSSEDAGMYAVSVNTDKIVIACNSSNNRAFYPAKGGGVARWDTAIGAGGDEAKWKFKAYIL